jgi:RNA polymerase sigma factor (sigma-70 family)
VTAAGRKVRVLTVDSDAEALAASRADPARFAALYDRHAAPLYRYAYQRVGAQTAEDAVADTFLAAFLQRESYDQDRADARPWLFGILTRKLARHHRTEQARYRALSRSAPETVQAGPAERAAERVTAGAIRAPLAKALRKLSDGDRDVLLLIAWCDFSYDEVAVALGIPLGTVRSRLNRARRKVREALGGIDPTIDREDVNEL